MIRYITLSCPKISPMRFIFVLLLIPSSTLLQAQAPLFNKTYNFTNQWENLYGIYETSDAYLFVQHNVGFTLEDNTLHFVKINLHGDVIWNHSFCGDIAVCKSTRGGIIKTQNNT